MGKTKSEVAEARPPDQRFDALFRQVCHTQMKWRVFADFCEMGALSLLNATCFDEEREERYKQIVGAYSRDEAHALAQMFGCVVEAHDNAVAEATPCDFLGSAFNRHELSSHWHGQFFTPMSVCLAIAKMLVGDEDSARDMCNGKGFVTVSEPACGAGAMVIAFAHEMRMAGRNPQREMHVTAVDVDATAAHMCFIQLSLLHVPALVYVGDTLRLEARACLPTLAHAMGNWDHKLRAQHESEALPIEASAVPSPIELSENDQLNLFKGANNE